MTNPINNPSNNSINFKLSPIRAGGLKDGKSSKNKNSKDKKTSDTAKRVFSPANSSSNKPSSSNKRAIKRRRCSSSRRIRKVNNIVIPKLNLDPNKQWHLIDSSPPKEIHSRAIAQGLMETPLPRLKIEDVTDSHDDETLTPQETLAESLANVGQDPFYSKEIEQLLSPVLSSRLFRTEDVSTNASTVSDDVKQKQASSADRVNTIRTTLLHELQSGDKRVIAFSLELLLNEVKAHVTEFRNNSTRLSENSKLDLASFIDSLNSNPVLQRIISSDSKISNTISKIRTLLHGMFQNPRTQLTSDLRGIRGCLRTALTLSATVRAIQNNTRELRKSGDIDPETMNSNLNRLQGLIDQIRNEVNTINNQITRIKLQYSDPTLTDSGVKRLVDEELAILAPLLQNGNLEELKEWCDSLSTPGERQDSLTSAVATAFQGIPPKDSTPKDLDAGVLMTNFETNAKLDIRNSDFWTLQKGLTEEMLRIINKYVNEDGGIKAENKELFFRDINNLRNEIINCKYTKSEFTEYPGSENTTINLCEFAKLQLRETCRMLINRWGPRDKYVAPKPAWEK